MKRKVIDEGAARLEQEYTSGQISYAEYRQGLTALYRERTGSRSERDAKVTINKEPWPGAKARIVDEGRDR